MKKSNRKFNIIISIMLLIFCAGGLTSTNLMAANAPTQNVKTNTAVTTQTTTTVKAPVTGTYVTVKSLDLVNNPKNYLNKRVKITAKFDKFSSLGLDYKPAMRSSEKYITFLIQRDDVEKNIPLSELKNFMKREMAEKFIDIETDDIVEYSGYVFSNALGDAWLEVEDFKILTKKNPSEKSK